MFWKSDIASYRQHHLIDAEIHNGGGPNWRLHWGLWLSRNSSKETHRDFNETVGKFTFLYVLVTYY